MTPEWLALRRRAEANDGRDVTNSQWAAFRGNWARWNGLKDDEMWFAYSFAISRGRLSAYGALLPEASPARVHMIAARMVKKPRVAQAVDVLLRCAADPRFSPTFMKPIRRYGDPPEAGQAVLSPVEGPAVPAGYADSPKPVSAPVASPERFRETMRRRLGEIGQTLDIEPTDYQGTTPGGRSACADAWNARRVQAVEAVKNAFEAAYVSPDHQNLPVLRAALEAVPLYRGRPTWADEAIRDALAAVKTLCWLAKEQELRRLAEEIPWMRR